MLRVEDEGASSESSFLLLADIFALLVVCMTGSLFLFSPSRFAFDGRPRPRLGFCRMDDGGGGMSGEVLRVAIAG